jgi:general stress protein 26
MAQETREKLRSLLKEFRTGMLVSRAADGRMRSRPMSIAMLGERDELFFATSRETEKTGDVEEERDVAVTFQSSAVYVSLTGKGYVTNDRKTIDEVWNEAMRVWFPLGKDDPALCIVRVRPVEAEYWDNSGMKGLRYLFEAAKAYVTGTTPESTPEQHGTMNPR